MTTEGSRTRRHTHRDKAARYAVIDCRRQTPVHGRSMFPPDAVARIYRPDRSVVTSGKGRSKGWRLVFDRRTPPFVEPLMGWTGSDDTLTQIELHFPTLDAAVFYAQRQGLAYVVDADRTERPTDAVPKQGSSMQLHEVELALLALERSAVSSAGDPTWCGWPPREAA